MSSPHQVFSSEPILHSVSGKHSDLDNSCRDADQTEDNILQWRTTNHRSQVQATFAPSFLQSIVEDTPSGKLSYQEIPQPEKMELMEWVSLRSTKKLTSSMVNFSSKSVFRAGRGK